MPVWVRMRLRRPGSADEVEVSAKVNTGFTVGPLPVVRLPKAVAERLGFDLAEAEILPGIRDTALRPLSARLLGPVEVRVAVQDRPTRWVRATAIYMRGSATVLINDVLAGRRLLGLVIEDSETGLWRLADDPPGTVRRSSRPEYWPEE